jgi:hypothetical protein
MVIQLASFSEEWIPAVSVDDHPCVIVRLQLYSGTRSGDLIIPLDVIGPVVPASAPAFVIPSRIVGVERPLGAWLYTSNLPAEIDRSVPTRDHHGYSPYLLWMVPAKVQVILLLGGERIFRLWIDGLFHWLNSDLRLPIIAPAPSTLYQQLPNAQM